MARARSSTEHRRAAADGDVRLSYLHQGNVNPVRRSAAHHSCDDHRRPLFPSLAAKGGLLRGLAVPNAPAPRTPTIAAKAFSMAGADARHPRRLQTPCPLLLEREHPPRSIPLTRLANFLIALDGLQHRFVRLQNEIFTVAEQAQIAARSDELHSCVADRSRRQHSAHFEIVRYDQTRYPIRLRSMSVIQIFESDAGVRSRVTSGYAAWETITIGSCATQRPVGDEIFGPQLVQRLSRSRAVRDGCRACPRRGRENACRIPVPSQPCSPARNSRA